MGGPGGPLGRGGPGPPVGHLHRAGQGHADHVEAGARSNPRSRARCGTASCPKAGVVDHRRGRSQPRRRGSSLLERRRERCLAGLRDTCGRVKAAADRDPEATNGRIHRGAVPALRQGHRWCGQRVVQADPRKPAPSFDAFLQPFIQAEARRAKPGTPPRHPRPALRRRPRDHGRAAVHGTRNQDHPPGERDRRPRRPASRPRRRRGTLRVSAPASGPSRCRCRWSRRSSTTPSWSGCSATASTSSLDPLRAPHPRSGPGRLAGPRRLHLLSQGLQPAGPPGDRPHANPSPKAAPPATPTSNTTAAHHHQQKTNQDRQRTQHRPSRTRTLTEGVPQSRVLELTAPRSAVPLAPPHHRVGLHAC